MQITKEQILGAVARGWSHPSNSHKEMDSNLAIAISDEIATMLLSHPPATMQMLSIDELDEKLPSEWNLVELCESVHQAFCAKNGLTLGEVK